VPGLQTGRLEPQHLPSLIILEILVNCRPDCTYYGRWKHVGNSGENFEVIEENRIDPDKADELFMVNL